MFTSNTSLLEAYEHPYSENRPNFRNFEIVINRITQQAKNINRKSRAGVPLLRRTNFGRVQLMCQCRLDDLKNLSALGYERLLKSAFGPKAGNSYIHWSKVHNSVILICGCCLPRSHRRRGGGGGWRVSTERDEAPSRERNAKHLATRGRPFVHKSFTPHPNWP